MLTRSLDKARDAFKNKSIDATIAAHSPGARADESHKAGGEHIKSVVYGGLDGTITTFAAVAGVTGAALAPAIVLIMGFANLIADGLSMAIGDYLSTKAEKEYEAAEKTREEWEMTHYPDGEKTELVELYISKGMPKKDAATIVNTIAKHKKAWLDIMMVEELGIIPNNESPMKSALVTFVSFLVFGFIPIAAYVVSQFVPAFRAQTFVVACILTGGTLFLLGALKTRITGRNWFFSGLEMLAVGSVAAAAAYGIGFLISGLVK
ncbi:MAG: VIT1/CCC1 transporter family protein [Spirochaetes bacterium]|nr:VIT1/CCC1 transporter family protein [Spirochaetota bacterium]